MTPTAAARASKSSTPSLRDRLKDPSLLRDRCFVDGAWIGTPSRPVTNPVNGVELAKVPVMGTAEATHAVEGAERVDRSLPHGVLSRQTPTMTPPGMPPPIVTAPAAAEPAPPATIEPAMVAEPLATVEPAIIVEAPAAADASEPEPVAPLEPAVPPAAPAQRRHRHRRHHRHR